VSAVPSIERSVRRLAATLEGSDAAMLINVILPRLRGLTTRQGTLDNRPGLTSGDMGGARRPLEGVLLTVAVSDFSDCGKGLDNRGDTP
jgi:hypothetical protein